MAERLTPTFKSQLEQWIGTGPKDFNLLYSISKDVCSGATFHQKCDKQGPTVTVLYNSQGTVFGGYTAINWDTARHGIYDTDFNAFLFRLQYNGKSAACKFPCIKHENAIRNDNTHGPIFGDGHDLWTFNGTIHKTGDTFPLNGAMVMNNTFSDQGVPTKDINNGSMTVVDMEVYQVVGESIRTFF